MPLPLRSPATAPHRGPWWRRGSSDTRLIEGAPRLRLRYEFVVVLCVRASSWKDAMLSRFMTEDRRADEGRERAEEVLRAISEAGLTLKVKCHLADDGAQLLMVFVTAGAARLQKQAQRLRVERWLQEEGVGDMFRYGSELMMQGKPAGQPDRTVVRVGGLHYFAPTKAIDGDSGASVAATAQPGGDGGVDGGAAGDEEAGAEGAAGPACPAGGARGGVGSGGVDGFGGGGGEAPAADSSPKHGDPLPTPCAAGCSVSSCPATAQHGSTAGEDAHAADAAGAGFSTRFSDNAEFSPAPGFGAGSTLSNAPVAGVSPAAVFGAAAASEPRAIGEGPLSGCGQAPGAGASSAVDVLPLSAAARVKLVHHILTCPPARGGAGMAARMKADARRGTILHMLPVRRLRRGRH